MKNDTFFKLPLAYREVEYFGLPKQYGRLGRRLSGFVKVTTGLDWGGDEEVDSMGGLEMSTPCELEEATI